MIDFTRYKTQLKAEQAQLLTELKKLGVQNPGVPSDWIPIPPEPSDSEPDANDLGDRSEDWQENRGVTDALETRLNNLTRALEKITAETYGLCEVCNEPIEPDRLDANPAARTCTTHLADEATLTN